MKTSVATERSAARVLACSTKISPFEDRETKITDSQASYGPVYDHFLEFVHKRGFLDVYDWIQRSTDPLFLSVPLDFLKTDLPSGVVPLDGMGNPCHPKDARRTFLFNLFGTVPAIFNSYRKYESLNNPSFKSLNADEKVAKYLLSRRPFLMGMPASAWSKDFLLGRLIKSSEGGNRSISGNLCEKAARQMANELVEEQGFDCTVSKCEKGVPDLNGRVSRIDILITNGVDTLHLHCKSSQTFGNGQAPLYSRDLAGSSVDRFGPNTENVAVLLGPNWHKSSAGLNMPKVIIDDFHSLNKKDGIARMKQGILDTKCFEIFGKRKGWQALSAA
jgi:hypothetical protein